MGIFFSKFRKKESTKEKLQKIDDGINTLEEYKLHTEQKRKKLVGNFIVFNLLICLVAAIVWYFYYLPPTWKECLFNATPFAGFLLLIYCIKNILTCYYRWKMRRNENKLISLKKKKEEILDQVMETETYKVAKDILETFAPEQIRRTSLPFSSPALTPSVSSHRMTIPQDMQVRRRVVSPQQQPQNFGPRATPSSARTTGPSTPFPYPRGATPTPLSSATSLSQPHRARSDISSTSFSSVQGPRVVYSPPSTAIAHSFASRSDRVTPVMGGPLGPTVETPGGRPMPRPILPRERGILERFVEYLVGDGPSNRYALVCRQCESHNGMALKDEFPYIAFRCAYCFYWNPARKQRPSAPRLEELPRRASADAARRVLKEEQEKETTSEEDETDTESISSSSLSSDVREDEDNCVKCVDDQETGLKVDSKLPMTDASEQKSPQLPNLIDTLAEAEVDSTPVTAPAETEISTDHASTAAETAIDTSAEEVATQPNLDTDSQYYPAESSAALL